MNEFQAAMGICNLRHLDEEIAKRKKVVERYWERLSGIAGMELCEDQPDVHNNYAYFPVIFNPEEFGSDRDDVFSALAENDIVARKYFYPLTSAFECYQGRFDPQETPVALRLSKRVLTLPLYSDLSLDCVDRICDIVLSCKRH